GAERADRLPEATECVSQRADRLAQLLTVLPHAEEQPDEEPSNAKGAKNSTDCELAETRQSAEPEARQLPEGEDASENLAPTEELHHPGQELESTRSDEDRRGVGGKLHHEVEDVTKDLLDVIP